MPSTEKSIIASTEQACQAYHDVSIDQHSVAREARPTQHNVALLCLPSLCFAMLERSSPRDSNLRSVRLGSAI